MAEAPARNTEASKSMAAVGAGGWHSCSPGRADHQGRSQRGMGSDFTLYALIDGVVAYEHAVRPRSAFLSTQLELSPILPVSRLLVADWMVRCSTRAGDSPSRSRGHWAATRTWRCRERRDRSHVLRNARHRALPAHPGTRGCIDGSQIVDTQTGAALWELPIPTAAARALGRALDTPTLVTAAFASDRCGSTAAPASIYSTSPSGRRIWSRSTVSQPTSAAA